MASKRLPKTHCPAGHALEGENLYVAPDGRRACKTCRRRQLNESRARRRPAVKKTGGVAPTPWQERFWRYVTPGTPGECWEWTGARNSHGYGRLNRGVGRPTLKAHRASYEIHFGIDPGELDVCHHCDNPPCVNPNHLFLGDAKANAQDMARKGRHGNPPEKGATITDKQVRELRVKAVAGVSYKDLAAEYGIVVRYAGQIANGSQRKRAGGPLSHLPSPGLRHSDDTIRTVRMLAAQGAKLGDIARDFGMTPSYVSMVATGRQRPKAGGPLSCRGPAGRIPA